MTDRMILYSSSESSTVEEGLSSLIEKSPRHRFSNDLLVVLGLSFFFEASRGLSISSIFTYIDFLELPKKAMGLSVGMYSLGRFTLGIPFGYWCEAGGSSRLIFITSCIVCIFSSTLYSFSWLSNAYMIYISRFLLGASSAPISITRSYIIQAIPDEEKTSISTLCGLLQYAGSSLSPLISFIIEYILNYLAVRDIVEDSDHISDSIRLQKGIMLEKKVLGPFLSSLILIIMSIVGIFFIVSFMPRKDRIKNQEEHTTGSHRKPILMAFLVFFFANFCVRGSIGIVETLAPHILNRLASGGINVPGDASTYFLVLGLMGVPTYISIDYMEKKFISGPKIMCIGMFLVALGLLFNLDFGSQHNYFALFRLFVGTGMIWSIGEPISRTLITSLFSKCLGDRKHAALLSYITTAGSLGRIVFPVTIGYGPEYAFYACTICSILCLFCILGLTRIDIAKLKDEPQ